MSYSLSQLGWDETVASAYLSFDRSDAFPGRVLRTDRGICTVMTDKPDGPVRAGLGGGLLVEGARDPAGLPCPGDWVVLRPGAPR
jgi:ribosome biogenesis GTPase